MAAGFSVSATEVLQFLNLNFVDCSSTVDDINHEHDSAVTVILVEKVCHVFLSQDTSTYSLSRARARARENRAQYRTTP